MRRYRLFHFLILACCLAWAGGCSDANSRGDGPTIRAPMRLEPATFGGLPSRRVITAHYLIETTVPETEVVTNVAQVLEGALAQYRKLAPSVPVSQEPMKCFVFGTRNQWQQFTEAHTGDDAKVYLRINRGGYAIHDWFVAYYIGERETYSVAAHEGFHQWVGRHFKRRPPPFLEEGLATLFESVDWENDLPRWRWDVNAARLNGLERAIRNKALFPLQELVSMHAGQVVTKQIWKVEAFYSQAWGFARFLYEADNGRYRPALQKMLADLAMDRVDVKGMGPALPQGFWNPATARPLLEHYLGKPIDQLDQEFQAYLVKMVASHFQPGPT